MIFKCWTEYDTEDDAIKVDETDFEEAAILFADYCWNEQDGAHWHDDSTIFIISDGETTKKFNIEVDWKPSFYIGKEIE